MTNSPELIKSLKPNLKSQFRNWNDFIWQVIILLPFYLYSYYEHGEKPLIVYNIFVLVELIPTAYLSVRYFMENRKQEYVIYENKIVKIQDGLSTSYQASEIKRIVVCKSASKDKGGFPFSTFETFRLARVYLNNGTNFIITNSLEYDIEKPLLILKDVKFERRKGFSFFI